MPLARRLGFDSVIRQEEGLPRQVCFQMERSSFVKTVFDIALPIAICASEFVLAYASTYLLTYPNYHLGIFNGN